MKARVRVRCVNRMGEFLDRVKELTLEQIQGAVKSEMLRLKDEIKESQFSGDKNKLKDIFIYYKELRFFGYLITTFEAPDYISNININKFRWTIEKLVKKKEIAEDVLKIFEQ
jgi:hypothetical protein